jgi:hypothetical protein
METIQTNKKVASFESIRAILHSVTERQKEVERQVKESAERLDKQLSKLSICFDEMVEDIVKPDLIGKFNELGLVFNQIYPHTIIYDKDYNILTEVDITMESGDRVMIVEAKSRLHTDDITDHVKRMEKLRLHADLHGDKRKYLGAIAGMKFNEDEKQYALKNGFYVVELCGDAFVITVPEGDYSPKEW